LKKNKISKNWINRQKRDIYVRQSKIEGFKSRAVYKLKEIDEKFKIFKGINSVVDLGAAPGSWSQYAATKIKSEKILSIDLLKFEKIKNSHQIIGDFTDEAHKIEIKKYFGKKIDLIISDMAVNTIGNKDVDSIVTGELCLEGMDFALEVLKEHGKFVSKIFMGSSFNEIVYKAKKKFRDVRVFKPLASRKNSKETFIICSFLR
tara:strand:+ start:802 stop:1413 length:612 start_codon:yes stop_codon:yes gene_type:complete